MNIITVTQINTYLKAIVSENAILQNIYIVGEISNFVHHLKSGHMYFTLKDDKSQIKCVMFSSYALRLPFKPQNGMSVICRGRVSLYEKDATCQLYCEDMQPEGVGALSIAFEQLKSKLEKEGLFDEAHKKPLPPFPKKIGVVTSDTGAAVEDIKQITSRRYPLCELVIAPTIVQGELAGGDIVKSLKRLDGIEDIDLIIVGRGGGSLEDLWAFNTEEVARAVWACKKPVISAVGHETDFTICDFVADVRASTPSAAAELAVPDKYEILNYLSGIKSTLALSLNHRLEAQYQLLDELWSKLPILGDAFISVKKDKLDKNKKELENIYTLKLNEKINYFTVCIEKLNALSPLATLARGYTAVRKNNSIINSAKMLKGGDDLTLIFSDGEVQCTVND